MAGGKPGDAGARPRRGSFTKEGPPATKEERDNASLAVKLAAENAAADAPKPVAASAPANPSATPTMHWVPKAQATARPERPVGPKPFQPTTVKDAKAFRFMNWNIEWLDHMYVSNLQ